MQLLSLSIAALLTLASIAAAQLPSGVVDTQPGDARPLSPMASLAKITVPEGFQVTMFAGEPHVYQPIAMEFDDRGRLWVAECYSYPDWKNKGQDRILIFEDEDQDGHFDRRVVFARNLSNITGIALGFGGVWACSTPNFIFIPDANQDDRPDGPPVIKLDGWNDSKKDVGHNVFNGMTWGPDGWMYGAHGILADSLIGKPTAPESQRVRMNCGIWRFHPVTEEFQVVAHGTTNPWGIDFDEFGQGFFTNCVIGHLWHLIPGARYKRMYGSHFAPYTYTLIDACSDHLHWGGGAWQDSRGGGGVHDKAGGGHAHVGAMIYRGGTWPKEYHGSMFTANLHGNRLNRDTLRRAGSGYRASHAPDFLHANDAWFRGLAVKYGPDGNVFVSDWTDLGECHDNDGTHRSSGRIYKISHRQSKRVRVRDLSHATTDQLVGFVTHPNAWYWTRARRILHERATRGEDMSVVIADTQRRLRKKDDLTSPIQLRLLSMLALIGGANHDFVTSCLAADDEHVQSWAVRHIAENFSIDAETRQQLALLLPTASAKLKLEVASALRTVPIESRHQIAQALIETFPTHKDANLLPMIWFAVEPIAGVAPQPFIELALIGQNNEQLRPLRQFIARRVIAENPHHDQRWDQVLATVQRGDRSAQIDMLRGLRDALKGQRRVRMPKRWPLLRAFISSQADHHQRDQLLDELAIRFQDSATIRRLQTVATSRTADPDARQSAISMLAESRVEGTRDVLIELLHDAAVRKSAIEYLRQFSGPSVPEQLLLHFDDFSSVERESAITTLVSRREYAIALMQAIAVGRVPATAIKPAQAAAIYQLRDAGLRQQLKTHWGDFRLSTAAQRQMIADWKARLSEQQLSRADLVNGANVFEQHCGKCHRLFGKGGDIGPDLTGSDRRNLDYVLQNVITPAAAVGKDYRLQTVVRKDGLTVSGALREQTPSSIVVQTAEKRVTIARREIASIRESNLSLMPAGQFDALSKEAVRDLVAYLASDPE